MLNLLTYAPVKPLQLKTLDIPSHHKCHASSFAISTELKVLCSFTLIVITSKKMSILSFSSNISLAFNLYSIGRAHRYFEAYSGGVSVRDARIGGWTRNGR